MLVRCQVSGLRRAEATSAAQTGARCQERQNKIEVFRNSETPIRNSVDLQPPTSNL